MGRGTVSKTAAASAVLQHWQAGQPLPLGRPPPPAAVQAPGRRAAAGGRAVPGPCGGAHDVAGGTHRHPWLLRGRRRPQRGEERVGGRRRRSQGHRLLLPLQWAARIADKGREGAEASLSMAAPASAGDARCTGEQAGFRGHVSADRQHCDAAASNRASPGSSRSPREPAAAAGGPGRPTRPMVR